MVNMKRYMVIIMFMFTGAFAAPSNDISNNNRIDGLRPDAPELAKPGNYNIGVRTLNLIHHNQVDVREIGDQPPLPAYDRPLTIEIWYPAHTMEHGTEYQNVILRDGKTTATLHGGAVRDAEPLKAGNKFPLIILSHGYPGNRYLMSHFGENLASKGYIVASIDHTDSLYEDATVFSSTLLNRPLDQRFVLSTLKGLNTESGHFLEGIIDTENTGLIGYSMGGYGAVVNAGAGISEIVATNKDLSPHNVLKRHQAGSETHEDIVNNDNFNAIIAIGPWGMERGLWDDDGLDGVRIPIMYMAGSKDTTSGYEKGVKALFEKSVNAERYLLTFENAGHNAAAPIPAPRESYTGTYPDSDRPLFGHYADPVWDTVRMNNIAQHYATAFFDKILKKQSDKAEYLIQSDKLNGTSFMVIHP
ncbi:alpha/beta hydrolase family protein [Pseudemcibacter aquimaris]|uniref:alpha/beta hydrolase family protein n=1 Tax=Pseudemcibacter aquimaris TaxID=2857064 RepID=UPI002012043D|nr:hypothetical protein [Pseudemcibacter aquimaris]MCC3861134.1 hypothetical protein [Pseudemcibacter aquimaris]WDU59951.1 hypothetical protein KW060_06740 [Pseudemcibacter aquimaris]